MAFSRPFAELAAKSNYSFLEGASHPEELVTQAKALGYRALAVVDRLGVYGSPRCHIAAKAQRLHFIVGAEVPVEGMRALLLAKNRNGYGNLCELLTTAHSDRDNPTAPLETLLSFSKDLYLLLPAWKLPTEKVPLLQEAFGKNLSLLVSLALDGCDKARLSAAKQASKQFQLSCTASNEPLFHEPQRKPLQDVLTCIRHGCTLTQGGTRLLPNAHRCLKSPEQMYALFSQHPEWVQHSVEIASQCAFSLDEIRYRYPTEWIPSNHTGDSYLAELAWEGVKKQYGHNPSKKVQELLKQELSLIQELEYSDYFLTIWDIVCFARSQGILCQGRGSAANSLVCYVLGITSIDPAHLDLLFERFISRERREPPDIDIDFEHERREEIIQYIYQRYGRHRAAITAEVICFRKRSALREVAKVFEISIATVESLQTLTHRRSLDEIDLKALQSTATSVPSEKMALYFSMVRAIRSFPRHLGTHVGGFVLCQDALSRNVPIEKAAMENRTIVQWDKNDLDALGFVRVDILGLGILTAIRKAFDLIQQSRGVSWTLASLPREDPAVYDSVCAADTVGVFQIESRAQMNMLPRLRPRCFYDLVIEISLVRPGPIQGDMVHPYLKRRNGEERIEYAHPELEAILKKTCGVPLFQEQIMKIAMTVAGFTGGQADELRRAMGSWRRDGHNRLSSLGDRFRQGLIDRGISVDYAQRVFQQIEGFAEYGFPESHAASFAVLVYATAYLKHYYPDAFLAALLNSQPMGFYSPHSLLHDGMRHGVKVDGISIQESFWDNTIPSPMHLRLGFRQIRGFRKQVAFAIESARASGFGSFEDCIEKTAQALRPTALTKRDLFGLAGAGAFECLGISRRQSLWEIQKMALADSFAFQATEVPFELPVEEDWERISSDYEAQGVCLHTHPVSYFREELSGQGVVSSDRLKNCVENQRIQVAGLVICRQQPPTASGVLFITLEDEGGFINLVIWKKVFEQYREALLTQSFLVCGGRIQRAQGTQVTHVLVDKVAPLLAVYNEPWAGPISYDFH